MNTTNDLPARLREHAAAHEELAAHDEPPAAHQAQWARDLREAAAKLERIAEPAATQALGHENGAERLCRILYGRSAEIGDTIGGLDAQMLHDAATELERMRKAVLPEDD